MASEFDMIYGLKYHCENDIKVKRRVIPHGKTNFWGEIIGKK